MANKSLFQSIAGMLVPKSGKNISSLLSSGLLIFNVMAIVKTRPIARPVYGGYECMDSYS